MGRLKRGGYLIEWWIGDHWPKHIHIYKDGREIAKVQMPTMRVLTGKINKRLKKILSRILKEEAL